MSKPKQPRPAYFVNLSPRAQALLTAEAATGDDILKVAFKDFADLARQGKLLEYEDWPHHSTISATSGSVFGKVGPFYKPKDARDEPILHMHVMPLGYILGKHEHHSTSDLCIVYADFDLFDERIIIILAAGSSHKGNMPESLVEKFMEEYQEIRKKLIPFIKGKLGLP
ncbi:hypothetical protein [Yersinia ruckeri]|uniref:hypothetical protein n=1 Tax=Yersinia ruckeri TaxID=29486 RepID=UPI002237D812|nr:hypothetical protein [Yersinia ruckeri]MCW6598858.1 hypothetical protein [Yersinia ruckeri]